MSSTSDSETYKKMIKKDISIEVVRSKNYQTVKQSSTITLEEGDDERMIRAKETTHLNLLCLEELKQFEQEDKPTKKELVEEEDDIVEIV